MYCRLILRGNSGSNDSNSSSQLQAELKQTQYPVTITTYDASGNEVEQTFEKAPERIVTNNLSATETLIELGLGDKIVGMMNPDNEVTSVYKDSIANINKLGDKKTISKEIVLSAMPDIIVGRTAMFSDKSLGEYTERCKWLTEGVMLKNYSNTADEKTYAYAMDIVLGITYDLFSEDKDNGKKVVKVAGLFGNLIKENATISGAQGGCQAEIGAAVSMGAAMVAYLRGLNAAQIEYAAEIGIEHHLGLTCDPVGGYVMIPCIERNAVGVLRAIDAAIIAQGVSEVRDHKVSFDMVVNTMNYTGKKIPLELRETSLGGLATVVPIQK